MFDFEFEYKDKRSISISGINEVVYYAAGFGTTVSSEEILTHKFPVNVDLTLKGKDCNHSISHDGLVRISIVRSVD
ncbi:MAG: hypothetical protein HDT37_05445 [Clostridiales bacterium]|nr:hypothetical protein [Clostridiales bacterium]